MLIRVIHIVVIENFVDGEFPGLTFSCQCRPLCLSRVAAIERSVASYEAEKCSPSPFSTPGSTPHRRCDGTCSIQCGVMILNGTYLRASTAIVSPHADDYGTLGHLAPVLLVYSVQALDGAVSWRCLPMTRISAWLIDY